MFSGPGTYRVSLATNATGEDGKFTLVVTLANATVNGSPLAITILPGAARARRQSLAL